MDSPETTDAQASRWFQRVLPVSAVAIVLIALAALVPAFRDQIKLSTSRQTEPYAELYFARSAAPNGQAVCTTKAGHAVVRFVIGSHLAKTQRVAYGVAVDPTAKGARTSSRNGSVQVEPGHSVVVTKAFVRPRERYTVSVRLPALDQQLRAHCPGRRS